MPVYDGWGFRLNDYDPKFFQGFASFKPFKEDGYKTCIRQLNGIIQHSYRKRRDTRFGFMQNSINYLLIFGLLSGFTGFIYMEDNLGKENKAVYEKYGGLILIMMSVVAAVLLFLTTFFLEDHVGNSEPEIFNKLRKQI